MLLLLFNAVACCCRCRCCSYFAEPNTSMYQIVLTIVSRRDQTKCWLTEGLVRSHITLHVLYTMLRPLLRADRNLRLDKHFHIFRFFCMYFIVVAYIILFCWCCCRCCRCSRARIMFRRCMCVYVLYSKCERRGKTLTFTKSYRTMESMYASAWLSAPLWDGLAGWGGRGRRGCACVQSARIPHCFLCCVHSNVVKKKLHETEAVIAASWRRARFFPIQIFGCLFEAASLFAWDCFGFCFGIYSEYMRHIAVA